MRLIAAALFAIAIAIVVLAIVIYATAPHAVCSAGGQGTSLPVRTFACP